MVFVGLLMNELMAACQNDATTRRLHWSANEIATGTLKSTLLSKGCVLFKSDRLMGFEADVSNEAALEQGFITECVNFVNQLGPLARDNGEALYSVITSSLTTNSASPVLNASKELVLHTDGALLSEPFDWILIAKLSEARVRGGESILLDLNGFLATMEEVGISRELLLKTALPYSLPPYSQFYDETRAVTYHTVLSIQSGEMCLCFASDILQWTLLTNTELWLVRRLIEALLTSRHRALLSLPVGYGYLLNNKRLMHGRALIESLFQANETVRKVVRIRGWFG